MAMPENLSNSPNSHRKPVFPNELKSENQITLYTFDKEEYKNAVKSWDFTHSRQPGYFSHTLDEIDAFTAQEDSTWYQVRTGFLKNELLFLIEVQRADLVLDQQVKSSPDTRLIDFRINPAYENNPEILIQIINTCLTYIFQDKDIKKVLWGMYLSNELFVTFSILCDFELLADDTIPDDNKFYFICERKK